MMSFYRLRKSRETEGHPQNGTGKEWQNLGLESGLLTPKLIFFSSQLSLIHATCISISGYFKSQNKAMTSKLDLAGSPLFYISSRFSFLKILCLQ